MWGPALEDASEGTVHEMRLFMKLETAEIPFGVIFACFMVCMMIGSTLFSIFTKQGMQVESIAIAMLMAALVSFLSPTYSSVHNSMRMSTYQDSRLQ